jgi:uncharacterized protein with HEPN domain
MSPDQTRLADIVLAAKRAMDFVRGVDRDHFEGDERTRWAVYSQIIIIGEAARHVSREFQDIHGEIPWIEITGMRHKLVHDYEEVDWDLVWVTVTMDLPTLCAAIEPLIAKEPET